MESGKHHEIRLMGAGQAIGPAQLLDQPLLNTSYAVIAALARASSPWGDRVQVPRHDAERLHVVTLELLLELDGDTAR